MNESKPDYAKPENAFAVAVESSVESAHFINCVTYDDDIMKKLLVLFITLSLMAISVFASQPLSTMTFAWTNGDNPTATTNWVTIVSYGISPGNYTNSVTVPYSQTSVTISNLVSATRYYASAQHSDLTDTSVPSNEANAKTKLNAPKNAGAQTP